MFEVIDSYFDRMVNQTVSSFFTSQQKSKLDINGTSPIKQENLTSSVEVRYMGKCLGRSEGLRVTLRDNPV